MAKVPQVRRRRASTPKVVARQDWVKNAPSSDDTGDWQVGTVDNDNGWSDVTIKFTMPTDLLRNAMLRLGCRFIVCWKES